MIGPISSIAGRMRSVAVALTTLSAFGSSVHAGGWHPGPQDRGELVRRRGQYDSIREGLGPGLLPYTRQGHWGIDHRYPKYPPLHAPVPAGPGDRLYESGRFPWQRG